jgi:NAD(P)H dehydrogenase (quinone)
MKHAVIFSHPRGHSFTASVAGAYRDAAESLGHTVLVRDLYRMKFAPCLKAEELPGKESRIGDDVQEERALIGDASVFVLVYPLWMNAPPAMIKGYLERVFGFGFAYGSEGRSSTPRMQGRKLLSFSSSGAPAEWLRQSGNFAAIHQLYDYYLADLCGFTPLEHVHFGNIVPGATAEFIQARLAQVRATVEKHFMVSA